MFDNRKRLVRWIGGAFVAATIAAAAPLATQAAAEALYSKTFFGDSSGQFVSPTCKDLPGSCNLSLSGGALPILVNPWEGAPIDIRCVQVMVVPTQSAKSTFLYAFAGNSYTPDVMVWAAPQPGGGASGQICYPKGTAMPFPAAAAGSSAGTGQNNFAAPHLDVHVYGNNAATQYQVYLTVWYTFEAQQQGGQ